MTPRALRIATATDASRSSGFPSSRHRRATWVKSLGVVWRFGVILVLVRL